MTQADFALQWLNLLGTKIYNKGEQVFKYTGDPKYKITPFKTTITPGRAFVADEDAKKYVTMPFSEFESTDYVITKNSDFKWRERQTYYYALKPKSEITIPISYSDFKRSGIIIQHQPAMNRLRIIGKDVLAGEQEAADSGVGPWMRLDKKTRQYNKKVPTLTVEQFKERMKQQMYGTKRTEQVESIHITEEIPILISEEGYVVCIPKQLTCQRIIGLGESGQGKSLLTNSWSSRVNPYGIWKDRVGWIIDPLSQFEDLSLPQAYEGFNKINAMIGNAPRPVPAIQLYMACANPFNIKNPNISMLLTQNFFEFLNKYKFYTFGMKDLDVGDSIRYLHETIRDLKEAKTGDEVSSIMYSHMDADKDKGKQAMIFKWKNTFETIFREKFTSNIYKDNTTATDELEVVYKDGTKLKAHPFIALYEAGVVPVLNIAAARKQRWIRNYLADLMNKVVAHQIRMGNDQHRVWIIADELNEIYEHGKRKDNAYAAFEELFRQGRFNNIGFVGNTQSLKKLNEDMFDNATHICCFYMKDDKSRKMIEQDYKVDDIGEQIESLKEREAILFSKQPFVIYDSKGNKKTVTNRKWFKGRIIPPTNYHKLRSG